MEKSITITEDDAGDFHITSVNYTKKQRHMILMCIGKFVFSQMLKKTSQIEPTKKTKKKK